jgi:hypothetical protein
MFKWFEDHSPPGAHQVGTIYQGVYYCDTAFWPVSVPIIFGTVRIDPLECLETMPVKIREMLSSDGRQLQPYTDHWSDCMDYGYGQVELESNGKLKPRAVQFLCAAHAELMGANSQLLESRPNVKAILGMRMATEILLKTVLVQERELMDDQLKKISHKLEDAASNCAEATGIEKFKDIARRVSIYPSVEARYENTGWPEPTVWEAARLAQLTAAVVTRLYSSRDIRSAQQPGESAFRS